MDDDDLMTALLRADRLLQWMTGYIGKMAPGAYANCYKDLNEHGVFMQQLQRRSVVPDQGLEP